jgi:alkanesulfonate monooxygenase SsuD/methylene tetrahydromethanopterin reductase-like flavin-dependent oxidoreductase (luciferase family)
MDAAQAAEEAGFDGVFVPEHHLMPDGIDSDLELECIRCFGRDVIPAFR